MMRELYPLYLSAGTTPVANYRMTCTILCFNVMFFSVTGWHQLQICISYYILETSNAIENTIHETDVKYGIRDRQKLDIFFPKTQGSGKCEDMRMEPKHFKIHLYVFYTHTHTHTHTPN